ncbi:MAG: carbon starvation protein A, partial [Stomatobaculum sp.]|nr:carbon starvation protein A [Stomatobaculum sp.]
WIVGVYIVIASVTPVWILLQPRDYLSSFLLYAMLFIAFLAVVLAHPSMDAMPTAAVVVEGASGKTFLFPVLFTTIACGAISGFHSLVSSGTSSKQLDKESDAQPIAYGGMLIECVLAILTLCAVGYAYKWNQANPDAALKGATAIFGGGIAHMVDDVIPGTYQILYTLLVLTYSAFCLTSLDTATRLARFMFQEFWLDGSKGETPDNVDGYKKVLTNPLVATLITVFCGVMLGLTGYAKIWALFGSANQLLAALGLLAVATWLGNIGKDNSMFLFPMGFMLVVTIASLIINTKNQFALIGAGGADWGPYVQAILGILLIILALILAHEGIQTINNQRAKKA